MLKKRTQFNALLVTLRPRHWIKNSFVLAPLVFSGRFNEIAACSRAALAFVGFCLVSSAVYIINDLIDRDQDRQHPLKKDRPIAEGVLSPAIAALSSIVLLIAGLIIGLFLSKPLAAILFLYFAIHCFYCIVLKHIVIVDVLTIAAGFVLRIAGGGLAVSVVPSYWLVLCTVMISAFLGFTKRRAELIVFNSQQNNFRPVLKEYSIAFLDQVIPMITAATIITYALYTVDEHTRDVLGSRAMLFTLPCVIYGMLRYIYIIYHLKQSHDPTDALLGDIPTLINLSLWILLSLFVVRFGSSLNLPW
jgi:4-hydroxybenzoate polyprenyltransferase